MALAQQSYTVIESASFVTVCANFIGQTERVILVTMTTIQGTAQGMYTIKIYFTFTDMMTRSLYITPPLCTTLFLLQLQMIILQLQHN